jgi:chromosome segregation ATPase
VNRVQTSSSDAQAKSELKAFYKEILDGTLKDAAKPTLARIEASELAATNKLTDAADRLSKATQGVRLELDKLARSVGRLDDDGDAESIAEAIGETVRRVRLIERKLDGLDPAMLAAELTKKTSEAMSAPGSPLAVALEASQKKAAERVDRRLGELSGAIVAGRAEVTEVKTHVEGVADALDQKNKALTDSIDTATNRLDGRFNSLVPRLKGVEERCGQIETQFSGLARKLESVVDEIKKFGTSQENVIAAVDSHRKEVLGAIGPVNLPMRSSSSGGQATSLQEQSEFIAKRQDEMTRILYATIILTVINLVALIIFR